MCVLTPSGSVAGRTERGPFANLQLRPVTTSLTSATSCLTPTPLFLELVREERFEKRDGSSD